MVAGDQAVQRGGVDPLHLLNQAEVHRRLADDDKTLEARVDAVRQTCRDRPVSDHPWHRAARGAVQHRVALAEGAALKGLPRVQARRSRKGATRNILGRRRRPPVLRTASETNVDASIFLHLLNNLTKSCNLCQTYGIVRLRGGRPVDSLPREGGSP